MFDWLGVRADLNVTQKNHRQYRTGFFNSNDYKTHNTYLQLPVMASFSFGANKVRGFLNLGVYGGYWLSSHLEGTMFSLEENKTLPVDEDVDFNDDRDQRWDTGLAGGIGVEYRFAQHWVAQVEGRCYYSTVSTQKDYMKIRDPKYNTTLGLQVGVFYIF